MYAQAGPSFRAPPSGSGAGHPNWNARKTTMSDNSNNSSRNVYSIPIQDESDDENYFSLIWGGEKMRLPLPPPDAKLSELRALIEERTGVAPEHQKLIVGGAVMQKDLPLKTYGLVKPSLRDDLYGRQEEDQSRMPSMGMRNLLAKWGLGNTPAAGKRNQEVKITMIASKDASAVVRDRGEENGSSSRTSEDAPSRAQGQAATSQASRHNAVNKKQQQQNVDEPRVIAQIDAIVTNALDKLKADTDNLLQGKPAGTPKDINKQYLMVSEVLLQTLMKLDGFEIDSSWTEARKARKEGIRTVQKLLDQVDAAKEKW